MSDAGSDIEHIILKAVGFHTVTIGLHKVSFSMQCQRAIFIIILDQTFLFNR